LKYKALSKLGLIRSTNQDRVLTVETNDAFLAMVCDGIGGGRAGDVASQMTIDYFKTAFEDKKEFKDDEDVISWFEATLNKVNQKIYKKGQSSAYLGMGTTSVSLVIVGNRAIGFNIGDSRLYDYRHHELNLLSHDQTYAYMMYMENEITKEEAENHPKRNVLLNAIGVNKKITFETIRVPDNWERLMLSSDGLHDYVDLEFIKDTFKYDIEKTADLLMELAYEAGGYDNISLVIVEGDKNES